MMTTVSWVSGSRASVAIRISLSVKPNLKTFQANAAVVTRTRKMPTSVTR